MIYGSYPSSNAETNPTDDNDATILIVTKTVTLEPPSGIEEVKESPPVQDEKVEEQVEVQKEDIVQEEAPLPESLPVAEDLADVKPEKRKKKKSKAPAKLLEEQNNDNVDEVAPCEVTPNTDDNDATILIVAKVLAEPSGQEETVTTTSDATDEKETQPEKRRKKKSKAPAKEDLLEDNELKMASDSGDILTMEAVMSNKLEKDLAIHSSDVQEEDSADLQEQPEVTPETDNEDKPGPPPTHGVLHDPSHVTTTEISDEYTGHFAAAQVPQRNKKKNDAKNEPKHLVGTEGSPDPDTEDVAPEVEPEVAPENTDNVDNNNQEEETKLKKKKKKSKKPALLHFQHFPEHSP